MLIETDPFTLISPLYERHFKYPYWG